MFSGLRTNSTFYILEKGEKPTLKVGHVISVSNPQAKYSKYVPGQFTPQGMDTVVDVKVSVNDEQIEFKQLPSNMQIANSGDVVVSESREAMSAEVEGMLRQSETMLDSIEYHKEVVKSCESILLTLNPQKAKEKAQEEKIGQLESKVTGMESTLSDIKKMLTKGLSKSV